ncbi:MAG: hypothetical protein ACPLRZ_07620 [Thermovenabulum sp.]|uniref:hypothetical protein n=1 Tax=Thermovenabulum sp. TaxID=3100335 RepID=UPI003C7D2A5B
MGLFKSKDEKEAQRKELLNAKMALYNLQNLSQEDKEVVNGIMEGLRGSGLIEFGTIFHGKAEDVAKLGYLRALLEQNWLIIKLLNEINQKLDKKG